MTGFLSSLGVCAFLLVLIWMAREGRKGDKEWCAGRDRRRRGLFDD